MIHLFFFFCNTICAGVTVAAGHFARNPRHVFAIASIAVGAASRSNQQMSETHVMSSDYPSALLRTNGRRTRLPT